jgi:hypothetical protein
MREIAPGSGPGASLLRRSGEALYGERWQAPLARDLGVALRTVQRWTAGDHPIPPGVWRDLCALLTARADDIAALLRVIADDRGAGPGAPRALRP